MKQIIGWIIFLGLIWYAYQAGWITGAIDGVHEYYRNIKQPQVTEEADGTITTVRYRNLGDILTGK